MLYFPIVFISIYLPISIYFQLLFLRANLKKSIHGFLTLHFFFACYNFSVSFHPFLLQTLALFLSHVLEVILPYSAYFPYLYTHTAGS